MREANRIDRVYSSSRSVRFTLFTAPYSSFTLVALDFGNEDRTVPFTFSLGGDYQEQLHGNDNLTGVVQGQQCRLTIPSNYGRVWTMG